jgi:hypothetical protein
MLIGVAIFSYFLGDFISIIGLIVAPPSENDEDELAMFFGLLKYFNRQKDICSDLKEKITEYFNYRWDHDRNMTLLGSAALHQTIAREIPENLKDTLFMNYLFNDFLTKFHFYVPKNTGPKE